MVPMDGSEPYSSKFAGSNSAIISQGEHARGLDFNFPELGFGWCQAKTNPEHLAKA